MYQLGVAVLRIITDISGFVTGLTQAEGRLQQFSRGVGRAGSNMATFARAAIGVSAIMILAFKPMIAMAAEFESKIAAIDAIVSQNSATIGNSAKDFEALTTTIRELGETTRFTATETGEASLALVRAGFTAREAADALRGTLQLASVGAMGLADAAEIAADTLRAFTLEARSLSRVVDVLAVTAVNANTTVTQLGYALSFASPTAAALGVSLEETAATLGVLANAGIKGTTAGTALSRVLDSLARGAERTEKTLAQYNITLQDVDPSANSLVDVLRKLEAAGLSVGDAMEIFGVRGGRAFTALLNQGTETIDEAVKKAEQAALASQLMMERMEQTLKGNVLRMVSAFEDLQIEILGTVQESNSLASVLSNVAIRVQNHIVDLKQWVHLHKELSVNVAKTVLVLGTLTGALGGIALPLALSFQALSYVMTTLLSIAGAMGAVLISIPFQIIAATIAAVAIPAFNALKASIKDIKDTFTLVWLSAIEIWNAFVTGFMGGYNDFIKPLFDSMEDDFKVIIKAVLETMAALTGATPMLASIAKAVGYVISILVALFVTIFAVITKIIRWGAQLSGYIVKGFQWLAKALGFVSEDATTLEDRLKKLRAAQDAAAKSAIALAEANNKEAKSAAERVSVIGKIADALLKGKGLTAQQLKELAENIEEFDKMANGANYDQFLNNEKAGHAARIAAMDVELRRLKALGIASSALEAARRSEVTALEMTNAVIENLNKALQEQPGLYGMSAEAILKLAEKEERHADALRTIEKYHEQIADIEKSVAESGRSAFQRKFDEVDKVRKSQISILKEYIEAVKNDIRYTKELASAADTEAQTKARAAQVRSREKELLEKTNILRATENALVKESAQLIAEEKERRDDILRDAKIQDAKLRNDIMAAAQLEAQKLIDTEEKKNQEILDNAKILGKQQLAEAEKVVAEKRAIDRRAAQDIINKAEKELFGDTGKEKSVKLEEDITKQLASQVRSLQDMYDLYMGIAMIRRWQEQQAFIAARQALAAEERLARLKANPRARQGNIDNAELRANFAGALADKRADEAGIGGVNATKAIKVLEANLKMLENAIASAAKLGEDFGNSFMTGVSKGLQEQVDNVKGTLGSIFGWLGFAQVARDTGAYFGMDFMQKAAKAITENSGVVEEALKQVFGNLAGGVDLSAIVPSSSSESLVDVANRMSPEPAFAGELYDNRSLNMNINNNVDLDNVTRHVGNAMNRAYNQSGTV